MQQIAPMAAMLPSALAGALGGAMGAVTSVPQQVGQQVMGAAQQIMQGAASSMEKPEDLGLGATPSPTLDCPTSGPVVLGAVGVAAVAARSQPGWTRRCRREAGRLPPRRHHGRSATSRGEQRSRACTHPNRTRRCRDGDGNDAADDGRHGRWRGRWRGPHTVAPG